MRISFTDSPLDTLLDEYKTIPVMSYDIRQLARKVTTVPIRTDLSIDRMDLRFLFDYKIFPASIMSYRAEWHAENREMKIGDTIVQQVSCPPGRWSLKMVFAVRICEMISEPARRGFAYETLKGHVEKGKSSFTVETASDGTIFKIETFSSPSLMMLRYLALPYQSYCTHRALDNVRSQIERPSKTDTSG